MDFLRRLFSGGGSSGSRREMNIVYFYVRPRGCEEVVRVRVDVLGEPSLNDEGDGYTVRKGVLGSKCFNRAELVVQFSPARAVLETEITGGELVDETAWNTWRESQAEPSS